MIGRQRPALCRRRRKNCGPWPRPRRLSADTDRDPGMPRRFEPSHDRGQRARIDRDAPGRRAAVCDVQKEGTAASGGRRPAVHVHDHRIVVDRAGSVQVLARGGVEGTTVRRADLMSVVPAGVGVRDPPVAVADPGVRHRRPWVRGPAESLGEAPGSLRRSGAVLPGASYAVLPQMRGDRAVDLSPGAVGLLLPGTQGSVVEEFDPAATVMIWVALPTSTPIPKLGAGEGRGAGAGVEAGLGADCGAGLGAGRLVVGDTAMVDGGVESAGLRTEGAAGDRHPAVDGDGAVGGGGAVGGDGAAGRRAAGRRGRRAGG